MTNKIEENFEILENNRCLCLLCNEIFSKYGIKNHINVTHLGVDSPITKAKKSIKGFKAWNKGLNKELDERVARCGDTYKERLRSGEIIHSFRGKNLSDKHKKSISESMKKAHRENRAWNIGQSRWNNESSFPEKFFIEVISNEFIDKDYIKEYSFHKFSLDFAWLHKKCCIEIDGSQHERLEEQIRRDKEKDILLEQEGWKLLRIKWKDMFHDSKKWISIAKDFVDSG